MAFPVPLLCGKANCRGGNIPSLQNQTEDTFFSNLFFSSYCVTFFCFPSGRQINDIKMIKSHGVGREGRRIAMKQPGRAGQVPGGGNFHNLDNLCISKVCNATSSNEILRFITLSCQLLPLSVFSLFQTYFSKDNTLFYLNLAATFNTRPFTLSECCSRK